MNPKGWEWQCLIHERNLKWRSIVPLRIVYLFLKHKGKSKINTFSVCKMTLLILKCKWILPCFCSPVCFCMCQHSHKHISTHLYSVANVLIHAGKHTLIYYTGMLTNMHCAHKHTIYTKAQSLINLFRNHSIHSNHCLKVRETSYWTSLCTPVQIYIFLIFRAIWRQGLSLLTKSNKRFSLYFDSLEN